MTWNLLEEANAEDRKSDDSILELILKEISMRLEVVESSAKNLSIPQDVRMEFDKILARLTALERKVNDFPSRGQVAAFALLEVTPVLEKLS